MCFCSARMRSSSLFRLSVNPDAARILDTLYDSLNRMSALRPLQLEHTRTEIKCGLIFIREIGYRDPRRMELVEDHVDWRALLLAALNRWVMLAQC